MCVLETDRLFVCVASNNFGQLICPLIALDSAVTSKPDKLYNISHRCLLRMQLLTNLNVVTTDTAALSAERLLLQIYVCLFTYFNLLIWLAQTEMVYISAWNTVIENPSLRVTSVLSQLLQNPAFDPSVPKTVWVKEAWWVNFLDLPVWKDDAEVASEVMLAGLVILPNLRTSSRSRCSKVVSLHEPANCNIRTVFIRKRKNVEAPFLESRLF